MSEMIHKKISPQYYILSSTTIHGRMPDTPFNKKKSNILLRIPDLDMCLYTDQTDLLDHLLATVHQPRKSFCIQGTN